MDETTLLVLATCQFAVKHVRDRIIPGYLIIAPREPKDSICELSTEAQAELGVLLANCTAAISKVLSPERIYFATFAEEERTFHIHIFPRTVEATLEYSRTRHSNESLIRGPVFFDWARDRYRGDAMQSEYVLEIVSNLKRELRATLAAK